MSDTQGNPAAEADRRFEERLAATGARDPRDHYRTLLKELKGSDPEAYGEMAALYRDRVVPRSADPDHDPLEVWLAYGLELVGRMAPGRSWQIDASGRAGPVADPPSWEDLILHLPDERRARAIPVSIPPEPAPAQKATIDLLVQGRAKLPEPDDTP